MLILRRAESWLKISSNSTDSFIMVHWWRRRDALRKMLECVPNFSEGRDSSKIEQIAAEVEKVRGVKLLDVAPDADHNRTVLTFVGGPESIKQVVRVRGILFLRIEGAK